MKIGIIGAGNMGGAIARGLINSNKVEANDLVVCDLGIKQLEKLSIDCPGINVSTDNISAVNDTDVVILAVKPWLVEPVLKGIAPHIAYSRQVLVSIAAGITIEQLSSWVTEYSKNPIVFRAIPNTAISIGQSMTFLSHSKTDSKNINIVLDVFSTLGKATVIEERLMSAATSLCSCGIAYAMRYVRAATEGGVELGMYPEQAKEFVLQTMRGAIELLEATGNNPEVEIDKVTTPGGITIKGLNVMEANGFTTAIIEGLKASK